MPGVENFLCPCGLLVGFDFLDQAESPAHALATLVQRFPLLPNVVFFDTAFQLARNAQRRLPWLLNTSSCHCFVDRLHNVSDQHKCSCIFDANKYPSLCREHRSACAESRHSLNKAFKTHLTHLRQDHFIVKMRILAAIINLRVMMRSALGLETSHRPISKFFHSTVVTHCELKVCCCANWVARSAETDAGALAQPAADVAGAVAGIDAAEAAWSNGEAGGEGGVGTEGEEGDIGGGVVSDAGGSLHAQGGMAAEEVLGGPPVLPGVALVSAGESEPSEASDSHSSAWESERD